MKKVLISLAVVIAFFLSGNVYSQTSFSLHAGASFPQGKFGEVDGLRAGGASTGLSLGCEFLSPLNDKGLGLFYGADLMYNGLQSDITDDFEENFEDVTSSKFINVPVLAGLKYTFKANDQVSIFGDFGVGFDFLKITDLTLADGDYEAVTSFDLSTQFAYKIGAGLVFNDKYIVGLHYNGLGKHEVKYETTEKGYDSYDGPYEDKEKGKEKFDVSLLTLTLGIKF